MKRVVLGAVLVVVVGIAAAAYAVGASRTAQDVVLCAVKKTGELSLAGGKGKCGRGEKKLTIAKQGPVGPQGAPGKDATLSIEAVHYVSGPPTDECKQNPGTFCEPSHLTYEWLNEADYFSTERERVGYFKDSAGYVHLIGVALYRTGGGGAGGGFEPEGPFYLPPGFRPAREEVFAAPGASGQNPSAFNSAGAVEIRPDGTVATGLDLVSLSGIVFKAG